MKKEFLIAMIIAGGIYLTGFVYFMTRKTEKVKSFKEVKTQTIENVEINKITETLPSGLYEIKVNDTLHVLVYSEAHGNSMIRIK